MTTPATAILGIDLGATEVKAGLVGLDGRLLAMARAGYGLDVGHGPGWAEQDPAAWWSAVVVAVRALRPPEPVDVVAIGVDGHGPTLAAVDERRRGHATGDHLPRYARDGRGRRARCGDGHPRLGARSAAGRPVAGAPRARCCGEDPLVPHDLGVAGLPVDRHGRRADRARPGRPRPDRGGGGDRPARRPPATSGRDGIDRRRPERRRRRGARSPPWHPGRRRDQRRLRELSRCGSHPGRRRLRPGRFGGRVRGVLARARRGPRRVRDTGAARGPVQRRRRDGGHRPGARLVPRQRGGRRRHDRTTARGGGHRPARRRRRRLPAVPGRRALARSGTRQRPARSSA